MVNSTDWTSAIMDLKFNHQSKRYTVDVKIYSQLAFLDSVAFCLCFAVCFSGNKTNFLGGLIRT